MTEERHPEFAFRYFDEQDALLALHARDMAGLLFEIDQLCRSKLKYEEPDDKHAAFCEEIRRLIREEVDLDRIWK